MCFSREKMYNYTIFVPEGTLPAESVSDLFRSHLSCDNRIHWRFRCRDLGGHALSVRASAASAHLCEMAVAVSCLFPEVRSWFLLLASGADQYCSLDRERLRIADLCLKINVCGLRESWRVC